MASKVGYRERPPFEQHWACAVLVVNVAYGACAPVQATNAASGADLSLARDLSIVLGNEIAPIFSRSRDTAHGPTSFRGAFGAGGAVDQYRSMIHEEDEQPLPPLLTSLSNIVPVGVQLEWPGGNGTAGASSPPAPFGRQLHAQRQKQGSQQRGPGRPGEGSAPARPAVSPFKRRAASEPQPEPSFGQPGTAAPAAGEPGVAPRGAKNFRFRVKLGGKVVASAGGGNGGEGEPPQRTPLEASAIVDSMCGLGASQLLSPLPTQWARIVDSAGAEPAAAPRAAASQPGAQRRSTSQPPPGKGPVQPPREAPVGERASPASLPLSPFASEPRQSPPASQPAHSPCQEVAGAAARQPVAAARDSPQHPEARAEAGQQPVGSPAGEPRGTAGRAAAELAQQRRRQQDQEQAPLAQQQQQQQKGRSPPVVAQHGKRPLEAGAAAQLQADGAAEGAPAAKRQRQPSAEPSGERPAGRGAPPAAQAAKRGSSLELPTPRPPEGQQQPVQPRQSVDASERGSEAGSPDNGAAPGGQEPAAPRPPSAAAAGPSAREARQQQQRARQERGVAALQLQQLADATPLGAVAAPLRAVLQGAAEQATQAPSSNISQLQDEGRRLKRFAEKRMAGDRHTHISCTFFLSSGLKFLAAAGIMEGMPHQYSRERASTMYSQTAAMLESCALVALRADGPALATQGVSLLAERLGAVARLRAAHCLRADLIRDAAAFRTAVESARGETFQRPSPTDSNVSATVALPLEGGSPGDGGRGGERERGERRKQQQGGSGGGSGIASPSGGRGTSAGGSKKGSGAKEEAPVPTAAGMPQLLGLPRSIVDRELGMAAHVQGVMAALSALGRSSERLRDYMGKAAGEGNVHALRAAAGAALLSADAGMGRIESVLAVGKEALDAAMKIES